MPADQPYVRPEFRPMNRRSRGTSVMHPGSDWHLSHWYEAPREDPAVPEVYTYTDDISFAPGEEVAFRSSSTAAWSLEVYRDGVRPARVHLAENLPAAFHAMPDRAYRDGCGWPVAHRWRLPEDMPSGFYRVVSSCDLGNGSRFVQHHFFVVRPADPAPGRERFLLLLPTATWLAYNDWGGSNAYDGIGGPDGRQFSPVLSYARPWTRGLVWLPPGAPRLCDPVKRGPWEAPRYPTKEWAFTNGFAQYYASAGWAHFDRHFAHWAEREGYAFDMITQTDLHYRPEILRRYGTLVIVGHDEYWTREMRETVDAFVEDGGRAARFAGNFYWQIRLEDEGRTQVAYKARAAAEDPVRGTGRAHLLTSSWEDPAVAWPGAASFGVNGTRGVYASWGGFIPRGSRGFTVYRPEHWCFDATDTHYGDILGGDAGIFAYEVDGLDYTFRDGLPYPTHADGAPESVEILAMAPAIFNEEEHAGEGFRYYIGEGGLGRRAALMGGADTPETRKKYRYGSGMVVSMTRGRGEVFSAGSCEWLTGLARGDFYTQQITRNVIERFLRQQG